MVHTPMMLLLNTEDALDHEEIRRSVREIAACGFEAVLLEFRHCRYNEFDDVGLSAMRVVAEECRRAGIGFAKIMPHQSYEYLAAHPEVLRRVTKEFALTAKGREEVLHATVRGEEGETYYPTSVIRAFCVEWDGARIVRAEDVTKTIRVATSGDEIRLSGLTPGANYLLYPEFLTNRADYADPRIGGMTDAFLRIYDEFEVCGFAMDEFGAGSRVRGLYLAGEAFYDRFRRDYGYDLRDRLYQLEHETGDKRDALCRVHYYDCTGSLTLDYQMAAKQKFTARYGKDIFIGFHHTWFGEGNRGDLWAGNADYFRLAKVLSGGFVDAQYDAERTMTSLTLLAESLARYSDTGDAFNMCWDRYPTPEKLDYYHRLLAVRNVSWVGHALAKGLHPVSGDMSGAFLDRLVGDERHGDIGKPIAREKAMRAFIGGAKERARVAMLYFWEGTAAENGDAMHFAHLSCKAVADLCVRENVPLHVLPSTETDFAGYDVIFAVWANVLRDEVWAALKAAVRAGKTVYFIGAPVSLSMDGRDLSSEFADLCGVPALRRDRFMSSHHYTAWDLWFTDRVVPMPAWFDGLYPAVSHRGTAHYYGYELPLTDEFTNVLLSLGKYAVAPGGKTIAKSFRDGDDTVVTLTPRWQGTLCERFAVDGAEITVTGGVLCALRVRGGKVVAALASGETKITANGEQVPHEDVE